MQVNKPIVYTNLTIQNIADELLTDEYANWTIPQAYALADYLIREAIANNEPMELDTIAIRCAYSGYKDAKEVLRAYSLTLDLSDKEIDYMDYGDALVLVLDTFDVIACDVQCRCKELIVLDQ